ncbi:peroxiredoxin [Leucobacter chromiireducens]|uniref:peroxiredoxin n=1 Tax=Leucobacter chromiireducens TaxID=283877 RepID=UPI003B226AED
MVSTPHPELQPGDLPPAVSFTTTEGTTRDLASLLGSPAVVYFYPAAFTPGCTTEACDFRDNLGALSAAGYTVYAVSGDDPETLARFAEEHALTYTLLSDPGHAAAQAWGSWGEKEINGQTITGALRSTFVLDADGRVTHAEYRVNPEGHVLRLREQLGV